MRIFAALAAIVLAAPASADGTRPAPAAGRQVVELSIESRTIPVVLLAPSGTPPERGFPLVVSLHGQGVDGGRECDHNWRAQPGIVVACPTERSAPWRDVWGERVVFETIRQLLGRFDLDPDRVFLSGASTGGIGAWRIAVRHPDRFAGVIPRAGMPPILTDRQLENLHPLGLYVVHGASDTQILPEADRRAAERLHELGGDVMHRELEGAHSAFPAESAAIAAWILRHRRDPAPRSFRYAIGRNLGPLPERVHWLQLQGRAGLPIAIEARVDRASGRVDVRFVEGWVENLRVLLDDRLVEPGRPVVVSVDGVERWRGIPEPDPAFADRLRTSTSDPGVAFDRSIALELPVPEVRPAPPRGRPRGIHRRRRRHRRHRR